MKAMRIVRQDNSIQDYDMLYYGMPIVAIFPF